MRIGRVVERMFLNVPLIITQCAGMFSPHASVAVPVFEREARVEYSSGFVSNE